jgi:hypothetical protein
MLELSAGSKLHALDREVDDGHYDSGRDRPLRMPAEVLGAIADFQRPRRIGGAL